MRWLTLLGALAPLGCSGGDCPESPQCSPDGYQLFTCQDDERVTIDCLRTAGQLCEAGACVDPWRYGSPSFGTCPNAAHATAESLAEKASHYDALGSRLHVHPDLGWSMGVTLKGREIACAPGATPPCVDPLEPAVAEAQATWADVQTWHTGENDGLWSALYLTSQAYRFGATRSEEALTNIRRLLEAEVKRMRITGVPGVFTRQLIPPGVPGISCPARDEVYTTDAEKNDNKWVQVREDGCVWVVDRATLAWTKSDHCGLQEFAGYCWLDNVSKDEYSGHMLALAAIYRLVDVPDIRATAADLLTQVGDHILRNDMKIVDWDGRRTEHGQFSPVAFDDFPGFNAVIAMAYVRAAAEASGRADIQQLYDECFLQKAGPKLCAGLDEPTAFPEFFESSGMYVGAEGCGSNYNNISMHLLSLHTLLWFEREAAVREKVQASFDLDVMRTPGQPRAIIGQHNALFDFMWAAGKRLGPGSDGPAFDAVEDGICMLRQFRASQAEVDITLDPERHQPYCKNRFGSDVSQHPRESWERCAATFVWWGDPYSLGTCTANRRQINPPSGYLLPYWMGRYYGFIGPEL